MNGKKALVLMVARIKNIDQAQKALENIEDNYLLDQSKNLTWTLIVEPEDAKRKVIARDAEIWEYINKGIAKLNQKYAQGESRFCACRRYRAYYPREKIWIGEERKRGAIMDFSKYIFGKVSFTKFLGTNDSLYNSQIPLMCVLDFDTMITKDAISNLIKIHNAKNIKIEDRNVVKGYGILQPGIDVIKSDGQKPNYQSITINQKNKPHYKTGRFMGKGIIHIPTFISCLDNRIPENMILSHDIIEGEILRTLYCKDIKFLEHVPTSINQMLKRSNRWVRGDTQNLVFLLDKTFPKEGKRTVIRIFLRDMFPKTGRMFSVRFANNILAISTSLVRMLFTKKNLLQWTPYNDADYTENLINSQIKEPVLSGNALVKTLNH